MNFWSIHDGCFRPTGECAILDLVFCNEKCDIMASRTAIIMVDTDNLLQYLSGKLNNVLDHFKENTVWLEEIQEEAKKMFISDFNAEPELMPKTPSERKRRRRRPSAAQDFSKRLSRNRRNLRRSSIQRTKIRSRAVEEDDAGCNKIIEQAHPVRLTRSTARAIAEANLETEKNHQNCTDKVEEIERECVEDVLSTLLKSEQRKEEEQPVTLVPVKQERRCTRSAMKIATDSLEEAADDVQTCRSSGIQRKDSSGSDKPTFADDQYTGRKRSYKCAVANVSNCSEVLEKDVSPPRKKSPSPPSVTASKVVRPKHKSFLHAVQKNQLLMTPVSVGRTVVKSFIKRNTPLKVDPKEQEKARLANLKKKREQEEERIQKVEEEKKRKLEEFKKKREMQVRRVLETRSRVEQQEAEKKKKIAQKFAQIDEKNAKMREERFAEEKAKKQLAAKRMEEAEARRRQEEEIRNKRLQQLEEERRELQQRKKEEELERQRKMAEARKFQEQRQAELERERLRELQLAADRERERKQEQENIQAEKERERLEKERALQLQRELERTAREDAALQAQREKERLHKEAEEKERKQEEQRLAELEKLRLEKEKTRKEQEGQEYERQASQRIREAEERKWKEEQDRKAEKETTNKNVLNVTVEVHNSPTSESYAMTPNSYSKIKLPKVNLDNYGMDLNSDDSTDDEGAPRKQIPAWANGKQLQQALIKQYYHPLDVDHFFGIIQPPDLKTIFGKIKPRYLKRTSSAVWHSPPVSNSMRNLPYGF
ncbi:inner centromere protein-like isoform X4 [Scyliorhinus canicula]|uniref:inner centromere protein-like isoform X4 n=1 Tax=Scyliorhinus canicula TaxID=7830 RepID=UPI0018F7A853|nr:inner centromere protein-like isoform X4 [Scyliorhinus canicula]